MIQICFPKMFKVKTEMEITSIYTISQLLTQAILHPLSYPTPTDY